MQSPSKANVLVVDDDEVVLVAITDLLEAAGMHVVTQQSPIGATQVIVRESIDLAIIDINLPVMQGDNMVRLLSTWDRVKEIPIVIISGMSLDKVLALQREMPQTRFVSKSLLEERLVRTVEELLQKRPKRPRAPSASDNAAKSNELLVRFVQKLSAEITVGRKLWRDSCQGDKQAARALSASLGELRGQAQLLGIVKPASLLQSVSTVVDASCSVPIIASEVIDTVESAFSALMTLERSPGYDFLLPPDALLARLTEATRKLKQPFSPR